MGDLKKERKKEKSKERKKKERKKKERKNETNKQTRTERKGKKERREERRQVRKSKRKNDGKKGIKEKTETNGIFSESLKFQIMTFLATSASLASKMTAEKKKVVSGLWLVLACCGRFWWVAGEDMGVSGV